MVPRKKDICMNIHTNSFGLCLKSWLSIYPLAFQLINNEHFNIMEETYINLSVSRFAWTRASDRCQHSLYFFHSVYIPACKHLKAPCCFSRSVWWRPTWHVWVSPGLLGCMPPPVCLCKCVREKSGVIRCRVNIPSISTLFLSVYALLIVTVCSLACVSAVSFQSLLASVCSCGCPPICLHIYTPPSLCAKPTVSVCLHVLHFCLTSLILSDFLSLCLHAIWKQCSLISTFTTVHPSVFETWVPLHEHNDLIPGIISRPKRNFSLSDWTGICRQTLVSMSWQPTSWCWFSIPVSLCPSRPAVWVYFLSVTVFLSASLSIWLICLNLKIVDPGYPVEFIVSLRTVVPQSSFHQ